jgi:cytochrome c peroxidase
VGPVTTRAPESAALVALGEALFFDKLLSGRRNVSCATCHHPTAGTGDALPLSLGEGATGLGAARRATSPDQVIPRNGPPLFAVASDTSSSMFWDGRVSRDPVTGALTTPEPALNGPVPQRPDLALPLTTALAAQAMFPVTSPSEMRGRPGVDPTNELADAPDNVTVWARLMARLVGTQDGTVGGVEGYRRLFRAAYPGVGTFDLLTFSHAARAIAAYEQATFAFFDAPLDRYLAGDDGALTQAAKRGGVAFTGVGRCTVCHSGPTLSDNLLHGIAAPQLGPGAGGEPDDRGGALVTGDRRDDYHFRTPSLRNVDQTAPFTHAGAYATLAAVVEHYRDPVGALLNYDPTAQLPPEFRSWYVRDPTRDQARLAQLAPPLAGGLPLEPAQIAEIVAFMEAMTDPRARVPVRVPSSVPSGLPVD